MEILKLEDIIPVINENKNYWLVRTQGGKYYEEFKSGNFIAIGWNKITLEDLLNLEHHDLVRKIIKEYPKRVRPVRLANQLSSFAKDIKAGDIVIIPSAGSNKITIGEVEDDTPYSEYVDENAKGPDGRKLCPFQKRRRVRWIKTVSKWDLDMEFYKLFKSQHTISNANEYAPFIDRMLHTFFIRGNEAHLILEVKKEGKIPFQTLFPMGTEILNLAEDFNKKTAADLDLSNIEVKINVQSPGRIHLTGPVKTMLAIGFLLVMLVGGEVSFDIPIVESTVNVRVGSLIEKVSDYLDRQQDREHNDLILKTYMKQLKVETPDELKTLMEIEHNPGLNHESNSKE
jgi:restriction system protein